MGDTTSHQPEADTVDSDSEEDVSEAPGLAKLQSASYALEHLFESKGSRRFSISFILVDDRVCLCYYDATGILFSLLNFSIVSDFDTVAAIILIIATRTPEQLGSFSANGFYLPDDVVEAPGRSKYPLRSLTGCAVTLEAPSSSHGKKQVRLTLHEPVACQYSLTGHRTVAYEATSDPPLTTKDIIIKISYQITTCQREQDLVAKGHEHGVAHLPDIHLAGDLEPGLEDIGRKADRATAARTGRNPYQDTGKWPPKFEDVAIRVIVYSQYYSVRPLFAEFPETIPVMAEQILSCEIFHIHLPRLADMIVLGIRDLWDKAYILHRDISFNNIMFELDENNQPNFVLVDLGGSKRVYDDNHEPSPATASKRTATLPYIALDLLKAANNGTFDPAPH